MQGRIRNVEPILPVTDVSATLDWYRENLDARNVWHWGDPVVHGGCHLGGSHIQFSLNPDLAAHPSGLSFFVVVENLPQLRDRLIEKQVPMLDELESKPWGMDEFSIADPNGVVLRLAESTRGPAGQAPDDYKVIQRDLTAVEQHALFVSIGWNRTDSEPDPTDPVTLINFVATDGEAIMGCASITGDPSGVYTIRNVVVRPEYQSSGVGNRIMETLDAWANENLPKGTMLHLFTGKPAFYQKLGYVGPESGLIGMHRVI